MKITQISFGKKIPIAKCQIQNKYTGEFVPATMYEVDCNDESDYTEVRNLSRKWTFKNHIANGIDKKNAVVTLFKQKSNTSIYQMRDGQGNLVGLAQTDTNNGMCNIEYLEAKPSNEYKYVGQTMVATIGKKLLDKNGYQLMVKAPVDDVMDFYVEKCGFTRIGDFMLRMNASGIHDLILRTEEKIQSPIVDIRV